RTAEAAGYGGAIIMKGSGDIYSPKAVRAAAGSILRFPVMLTEEANDTAEVLLKNGKRIISTKADAENDFRETDLTGNTALVIGNEGKGVSDEFISLSDETLRIPMKGEVDSLNAAVAAGILMYSSI
ncbi:MAG TPA: RNA methyltransferase, partial [Bacillota bacterium]|nr:RNA methyltransferase [Bacillota bacterium]